MRSEPTRLGHEAVPVPGRKKWNSTAFHPSLVRQSILNNNYGFNEVIPGIYRVVWDRYGTGSQGCIFNRYPRF